MQKPMVGHQNHRSMFTGSEDMKLYAKKKQIWRPSWIFGASNIPILIPMIYLHLNII